MDVLKGLCIVFPFATPFHGRGNIPAFASLISWIALQALKFKNISRWEDNIDDAMNALSGGKATEFPHLCRQAIIYGLLPKTVVDWGGDWLLNQAIISIRGNLLPDQIKNWLSFIQKKVPIDFGMIQNPEEIIANDYSTVIDESVNLLHKVLRFSELMLKIFKIYRLSSVLHHPSLSFPFNRLRGSFGIILGFMGIMVLCQAILQIVLQQFAKEAKSSKEAALDALKEINNDRPRFAGLPDANKSVLTTLVGDGVRSALEKAGEAHRGFLVQEPLSYTFPTIFQLFITGIACNFTSKIPGFDSQSTLSSLLRESISFMWQSSYFLQYIMNGRTQLGLALGNIASFEQFLDQDTSNIPIERGEVFHVDNLSFSIREKEVCNSFSCQFLPGKTMYLRGPNGCGKTAFFGLLQNLVKAQAGKVNIPHNVFYLSGVLKISPKEQTLQEMLKVTFGICEREISAIQDQLNSFQAFRHVPELMNGGLRNWNTLSAGQKQILHWITTFQIANQVGGSTLIIGDEATANMDDGSLQSLDVLKKDWMKDNRWMLIVDHNKTVEGLALISTEGTASFQIFQESS